MGVGVGTSVGAIVFVGEVMGCEVMEGGIEGALIGAHAVEIIMKIGSIENICFIDVSNNNYSSLPDG